MVSSSSYLGRLAHASTKKSITTVISTSGICLLRLCTYIHTVPQYIHNATSAGTLDAPPSVPPPLPLQLCAKSQASPRGDKTRRQMSACCSTLQATSAVTRPFPSAFCYRCLATSGLRPEAEHRPVLHCPPSSQRAHGTGSHFCPSRRSLSAS